MKTKWGMITWKKDCWIHPIRKNRMSLIEYSLKHPLQTAHVIWLTRLLLTSYWLISS